jgi:hypothetical protein
VSTRMYRLDSVLFLLLLLCLPTLEAHIAEVCGVCVSVVVCVVERLYVTCVPPPPPSSFRFAQSEGGVGKRGSRQHCCVLLLLADVTLSRIIFEMSRLWAFIPGFVLAVGVFAPPCVRHIDVGSFFVCEGEVSSSIAQVVAALSAGTVCFVPRSTSPSGDMCAYTALFFLEDIFLLILL